MGTQLEVEVDTSVRRCMVETGVPRAALVLPLATSLLVPLTEMLGPCQVLGSPPWYLGLIRLPAQQRKWDVRIEALMLSEGDLTSGLSY